MLADTIYDHLHSIHQMNVKELIEPPILVNSKDTITQVINQMEKSDAYDVFCVEGKSVLTTNLRSLLSSKNIIDMKILPFLYPIPTISVKDNIQQAANIMTHYRIRSVPVLDNGKIIGVITAKKILEILSSQDNRWIKANLIFTKTPITISTNETLGTARKLMISKKIDHLPVEKNGKITQVLTSYHLVNTIVPQEKLGRQSRGMKKVGKLESKIANIGSTRIPQCSPDDDLTTILNSMLKVNATCCIVNLWDNLLGIITYRDILSLLAIKMEGEISLYIVGLPDGQKNSKLIADKLRNTLKRIRKAYSEIQEARVTIKQQRTGNKKKGKYEITIRILTPHHSPYIFKEVGFDVSNAIESLSQKLLRILSKKAKQRNKTSIRKINLPAYPL